VIAIVRPNLNSEEMRELEELIPEYEDAFVMKDIYYGQTNRVYHRIDEKSVLAVKKLRCEQK
jgi:hypothetical protein